MKKYFLLFLIVSAAHAASPTTNKVLSAETITNLINAKLASASLNGSNITSGTISADRLPSTAFNIDTIFRTEGIMSTNVWIFAPSNNNAVGVEVLIVGGCNSSETNMYGIWKISSLFVQTNSVSVHITELESNGGANNTLSFAAVSRIIDGTNFVLRLDTDRTNITNWRMQGRYFDVNIP